MKAVMSSVPEHILEWRKRTGVDRWDEMWKGVLHLMPAPENVHQELQGNLQSFLCWHWARSVGAKVIPTPNSSDFGGTFL